MTTRIARRLDAGEGACPAPVQKPANRENCCHSRVQRRTAARTQTSSSKGSRNRNTTQHRTPSEHYPDCCETGSIRLVYLLIDQPYSYVPGTYHQWISIFVLDFLCSMVLVYAHTPGLPASASLQFRILMKLTAVSPPSTDSKPAKPPASTPQQQVLQKR